jgi:hypothetical protein
MSLKNHPFFQALDRAEYILKKTKQWAASSGLNPGARNIFYKALKEAKPFIFDKRVTMEKRHLGRACVDVGELVQDFSLPFATSLYLMMDSPQILAPPEEGSKDMWLTQVLGYLIKEESPEEFVVWCVSNVTHPSDFANDAAIPIPAVNRFNISLKTVSMAMRMAESMGEEIFNEKTEAHILKETSVILQFTNSVSVKRVGVEVARNFSVKSKGIGAGFTAIKYDNIVHIADKEEYEYTKPVDDSKIDWEFRGLWRGHWRAFYVKDLKDQYGRNVVDYGRIGKNRNGDYVIPGYTWVVEHTKGDARLAEIKTRTVKHERS